MFCYFLFNSYGWSFLQKCMEIFLANFDPKRLKDFFVIWRTSGQSYKHFTIVNYNSRVAIYERRGFIRLATGEIIYLNFAKHNQSFIALLTELQAYPDLINALRS